MLPRLMGMTVELSTAFVQSHDLDASLAFYRDLLGLEVRLDVANEGFRWVTVGAPGQSVSLVLSDYVDGTAAEVETIQAMLAKGSLNAVQFSSSDLDDTFARLAAGGAEVVQPPTQQPWGAKDGAVRDPSGNLIRINQA